MPKYTPPADPASINLIGEGSAVEGTVRSSTDVRVNGTITGDVEVDGKVIVAEKGFIDGTLTATNADIAGRVVGDLTVENRLLLKATARVHATVKTGRLVVEEGAEFDGSCDMGRLEEHRKEILSNGDGSPEGARDTEFVFESANHGKF
jgi:cytoskeletal protein CcmA (bactofilin family)